ncbi:MAG: GYD domain-containing protein [Dehalococcoidia bacterium]|nr:GYD domain-containing protein [Dehalococcoidia bacterium]
MPIYIALTNVSAEGRKAIKEDPARIKANNREIEAMGVKIIAQYATLGQYDFINIFEAPNDEAIFKVALNLTGRGVDQVQTLTAKTLDDFIAATKGK